MTKFNDDVPFIRGIKLKKPKPLDNFSAVMIAEGVEPADADTTRRAWQHLVDTGLAWQLQGWFGRTASDMIKAGLIERRGG